MVTTYFGFVDSQTMSRRPVLVAVSAHGSASDRNCAPASTICLTMANRWKVERASRSMRVTVTTSPEPSAFSIRSNSRRVGCAPLAFSR
jgi:hypothetical protein